jgi:alkylated DNA repair dioxygenase AlkB
MNVPGLELFQGFVTQQFQRQLVGQIQRLLFNIAQASEGKCHTQSAQIPKPVRSQFHNLAEERNFLRLKVDDESTRILSCEHFPAYGSRWHSLTYFRGNENLPQLALPLVEQLAQLPVIQTLGESLRWKMTLNYYQRKTEQLFPFHTDIASNGSISAILPLLASSIFELTPNADPSPAQIQRLTLLPGSLLLLSGPARWDYLHRTLAHPDAPEERLSLVFGCANGGVGKSSDADFYQQTAW